MTMLSPEQPKAKEKPGRAQMFEHLFPGNKFNSLTPFNPLNVPKYIGRLLLQDDLRRDRLLRAIRSNHGFAERVNLSHPDKLTMAYDMADLNPFPGSVDLNQVKNLLREGETLGGVAVKPISWLAYSEGYTDPASFMMAVNEGADPYIHGTVLFVGVLNKDGKPTALIEFKRGKKPVVATK